MQKSELYRKFLDNKIDPSEIEDIKRMFEDSDEETLRGLVENAMMNYVGSPVADEDLRLQNIFDNVVRERIRSKRYTLRMNVARVAAAVAAIALCVYFFTSPRHLDTTSSRTVGRDLIAKDLPGGKSGATLTLANGKKIRLVDALNGKIANESGVSVSKTAEGQLVYQAGTNADAPNQINTLSTARGETYILTLPDKTQVWLNAASSLTYSVALNEHGQRRVKLSGEAYFQVAKDKAHPFIVETDHQEVKVLGTHFNINSYETDGTVTTLEEGSVRVSSLRAGKQSVTIKPGEQVINSLQNLNVQQADLESALAWKDGLLLFKDAPLKTVLAEVSRWYDVDIEYRGTSRNKILSGGVNRTANLSAMQKILKLTGVNTTLVVKDNTRKLIVD